MAAEMRRAHVLAVTSSIESLSNALSEAMAVGTPCTASFVGGMPSLARHETEAIFYPFGDVPLLAESIRRIFAHDSLAVGLSQNARRCARARYQSDNAVARLLSIYREIANGCKRQAAAPPFHVAAADALTAACANHEDHRI
jgi:glycosyltransferase involved in cell wall biosynthesis